MNPKNLTSSLQRRHIIKYGGAFLGTGLMATVLGKNLVNPETSLASNSIIAQNQDMTPEQALTKLMEGNQRFVTAKRQNPNQDLVRLQAVSQIQNPFAAVLSCADSRVPVEFIFDQGLGDIFVCRNAGNVVTDEEIGSLEFGALVLGAKVLLVIGHQRCGAVTATLKNDPVPGSIGSILAQIKPGVTQFQGEKESAEVLKKATEANVLSQVNRLKKSPILSDLVANNKLKIVGAYYALDNGKIILLG